MQRLYLKVTLTRIAFHMGGGVRREHVTILPLPTKASSGRQAQCAHDLFHGGHITIQIDSANDCLHRRSHGHNRYFIPLTRVLADEGHKPSLATNPIQIRVATDLESDLIEPS